MVRSRHRPSSQRLPSLPRRNSAKEKTIIDMLVMQPYSMRCTSTFSHRIEQNSSKDKLKSLPTEMCLNFRGYEQYSY